MVRWWLYALTVVWLLSGVTAIAQEVTATLDRTTIFEGETVLLRVDQLNPAQDAVPDYSPLNENFRILDTGTNSSLEVTNGQRRLVVQHNVLLEPRSAGETVVPPLQVGTAQTLPIAITVMPRPDGSRAPDQDVYIEAEADPVNPYVHSQIRFTVRLFHSPPITEGSLNPEAWPEGLVVERIGEDQTYQTRIGEARYRVIERRYALFPERSGTLILPEVRFRGRVADPTLGRTSLFSRGRRVSVESKPIEVQVRPQPAGYTGDTWIPASSLEITEVWPDGEPSFVQGEPVTRTLIVKARGLLAAQLPEIGLPELAGLKVYPDQATTRTHADGGWAVAQREQKFALVPTQPGALTLPEIRVPWWDTEADVMRIYTVPPRDIIVLPGSAVLTPPPELPLGSSAGSADGNTVDAGIAAGNLWRKLALLFAGLWLVTSWLWWRGRGRAPRPEPADRPPLVDRNWQRRLIQDCEHNDPRAAARAVLGLVSAAAGYPVHNLAAAARLVDARAADVLLELDRHLYREGAEEWNGDDLKAVVEKLKLARLAPPRAAAVVALPPLYNT